MHSNNPIGFFDSGVGGTSIWSEVVSLMPYENTIYLADSANAPYGRKSQDEITALCIKNVEYLLSQNCKLIVVACNTATTNSIASLRATYNVPFIGIEPAIKPAALLTNSNNIGVLATQGTLSSALFHEASKNLTSQINCIEVVGTGIVELVENGKKDSEQMRNLLRNITEPFMVSDIDYLVLGCTHYPYIKSMLEELLPSYITIIDSGEAVARQTQAVLVQSGLTTDSEVLGNHLLCSNQSITVLSELTDQIKNRNVVYLKF